MTRTTAWIRSLTKAVVGTSARGDIDGSHCHTRQDLFAEWANRLGFPDYFSPNWDAFHDCLRDAVSSTGVRVAGQEPPAPHTLIIREAGDLLADEPRPVLVVFLSVLGQVAGDDSTAPRLLLLLDDTPDRLAGLARRMTEAGVPVTI